MDMVATAVRINNTTTNNKTHDENKTFISPKNLINSTKSWLYRSYESVKV